MSRPVSHRLFQEAKSVIPGGVNSPVRAFGSVGGEPLFIKRAEGAYLWDEDGRRYLDFVGSWGPMILGHAHPEVLAAVKEVLRDGFSFGAPTAKETMLAEKVRELMPAVQMVRLVSSGTEACMAALRLARGFTGRQKIIKFQGCYHGHADMLLVKAGSGMATLGIPGSPGVPEGATSNTLTAAFNDLEAVAQLFATSPTDIAAVILEPIVGNAGFIRPEPGFLEGLRELCSRFGALLIFDEVMTGFRVGLGGVEALYKIQPDLVTLGKVMGGGMPLAAYGGRKDIMSRIAPSGDVYQAGTLSGNPIAVTCGLKTLEVLQRQNFEALHKRTRWMMDGLVAVARETGHSIVADSEGGMFGFNFHTQPIRNFADAQASNQNLFNKFFWGMLDEGMYLAPSAFEAGFVSFAHTDADIEAFLAAAGKVLAGLKP